MKSSISYATSAWFTIQVYDRVQVNGWGAFGFCLMVLMVFGCVGMGITRAHSAKTESDDVGRRNLHE